MLVERFDEPWPHLIIDDFVDEITFKHLLSYFDDFNEESNRWRKRQIYKWNELDAIQDKIIFNIISNVRKIWDTYYLELSQGVDERELVDNVIFETVRTKPMVITESYQSSAHPDSRMKLMSMVYYISENGAGTSLHNLDGYIHHTLEWKQNRLFVFVRQQTGDGITLHSKNTNTQFYRDTINLSVCQDKSNYNTVSRIDPSIKRKEK